MTSCSSEVRVLFDEQTNSFTVIRPIGGVNQIRTVEHRYDPDRAEGVFSLLGDNIEIPYALKTGSEKMKMHISDSEGFSSVFNDMRKSESFRLFVLPAMEAWVGRQNNGNGTVIVYPKWVRELESRHLGGQIIGSLRLGRSS